MFLSNAIAVSYTQSWDESPSYLTRQSQSYVQDGEDTMVYDSAAESGGGPDEPGCGSESSAASGVAPDDYVNHKSESFSHRYSDFDPRQPDRGAISYPE